MSNLVFQAMKNDAPQIFQISLLFFTGGHFVFGKKQVFFPFPEEQNSWWRLSLHQESTKALGGDLAYTKSPPRLLVEIQPTPRVHQGSWWRFSLHQESTKALGGDLAYTKSPPRLLVEIQPTPRVHQGSWWRMSLHQESTKNSAESLGGDLAYTKSPPRLLVDSWWTFQRSLGVHQENSLG